MYALQPQKKSNGRIPVLAVIAVALVGLMIVVVFLATGAPSSARSMSSTHRVIYKVTTSVDTSVHPSCVLLDTTYEMASGTAQKGVTICGGARSAEVDQFVGSSGDFVYLAAQNSSKYFAKISCAIYVDGKLLYQTYSEGKYVSASCSGSIP